MTNTTYSSSFYKFLYNSSDNTIVNSQKNLEQFQDTLTVTFTDVSAVTVNHSINSLHYTCLVLVNDEQTSYTVTDKTTTSITIELSDTLSGSISLIYFGSGITQL